MTAMASYAVRQGYVYTDASAAAQRTYAAGEVLVLPTPVGDAAHQLERVGTQGTAKPARQRTALKTAEQLLTDSITDAILSAPEAQAALAIMDTETAP